MVNWVSEMGNGSMGSRVGVSEVNGNCLQV
jgi:hypothetical protein